MKYRILIVAILFSVNCFGQHRIVGQTYSIVTGKPLSQTTLRVDKKQLIQADTNGVFEFKTSRRIVIVRVEPFNIYRLDTLLSVNATTDTVKLFIAAPIDSTLAAYDIKHHQVQLFCGGGYAPLAYMPSDKTFEHTYQVKYHMLDCIMPDPAELTSYNQRVAVYLDARYGTIWRATLRPDIVGISKATYH